MEHFQALNGLSGIFQTSKTQPVRKQNVHFCGKFNISQNIIYPPPNGDKNVKSELYLC